MPVEVQSKVVAEIMGKKEEILFRWHYKAKCLVRTECVLFLSRKKNQCGSAARYILACFVLDGISNPKHLFGILTGFFLAMTDLTSIILL